jgi:hypothetical protein
LREVVEEIGETEVRGNFVVVLERALGVVLVEKEGELRKMVNKGSESMLLVDESLGITL